MMAQRGPTPAPYFSLADGAWIPYALTWDPETGAFRGVEGRRGFGTYCEAVERAGFWSRPGASGCGRFPG